MPYPVRYTVSLAEENGVFILDVSGETAVAAPNFEMNHAFAEELADGYATFTHDLQFADASGAAIAITGGGQIGWTVETTDAPLPWTWRYRVALTHETLLAPSMRDETPHRTGDYAFFVGRSVFVYPEGDYSFTVNVASTETFSTLWATTDGTPRRYAVADTRELTESFLIFGDHEAREWREAGADIRLTVQGAWREKSDILASAVSDILRTVASVFGNLRAPRVLVAIETTQENVLRGGVIGDCVSGFLPTPRSIEGWRDVWGSFLLHEIFHLWNGGHGASMEDAGVVAYWFSEGFTCHYQDVFAARLGWITPARYATLCEKSWERYETQAALCSLHEAGTDKGSYSSLVYDGGRVFALLLNRKIEGETGGAANLDTLMRALLARFAEAGETMLPSSIVAETAAAITGTPLAGMREWFDARLRVPNGLSEAEFREAVS